jgi:hypothetical protein
MFKSTCASPSNLALADWLLARIAGRDRAAAILGDLLEISAARGRLWFWIAYTRTLISLGWRTPVGYICSLASLRIVLGILFHMRMHYGTSSLMEAGIFGVYSQHARALFMNLSLLMGQCMIFAVPFTLVRFGPRDRLSRLACVLLLVALPVYSQRPLLMDLSGVLTALAVFAALVSSLWRKPLAILAATGITSMASFGILASLQRGGILRLSASTRLVCIDIGIAIAVVVCLYLHRLLLRPRPATALA